MWGLLGPYLSIVIFMRTRRFVLAGGGGGGRCVCVVYKLIHQLCCRVCSWNRVLVGVFGVGCFAYVFCSRWLLSTMFDGYGVVCCVGGFVNLAGQ